MDLATCQRKLLSLFRGTHAPDAADEEYVQRVVLSKHLAEGRRNIFLWRVYVLERTCPLTVNLLRNGNLLGNTVNSFIARHNISPFRETQAPAFLEELKAHDDRLVASVAQFELALMKVRNGDCRSYVVFWDIDPHPVLKSLALNVPVDSEIPRGCYEIRISHEIPGHFVILLSRPIVARLQAKPSRMMPLATSTNRAARNLQRLLEFRHEPHEHHRDFHANL